MSKKMENPWNKISISDMMVAPESDIPFINKLLRSQKYKKLDNIYSLKLHLFPQHFVGDIENSKIIVLSLNPGFSNDYDSIYKKTTEYKDIIEKNLNFTNKRFHAFDLSTSKENGYWDKKLRPWFESSINEKYSNNELGIESLELDNIFTNAVSLIEFFPYHSEKYHNIYDSIADEDYLPSQKFVFSIIENRIKNKDAIIILARSFNKWYKAIPALKSYEKCFEVNNPQNPSFKFENIYRVIRNPSGDIVRDAIINK